LSDASYYWLILAYKSILAYRRHEGYPEIPEPGKQAVEKRRECSQDEA